MPAPPEFKVTPEVKLFRVTPQGGLVTLDGQPTRHQLGFIKGIFGLGSQYKVIQTFQGGHQAIESVEGDGSFVSYLDNKKVRIDGWPPRFTEVQNRLFESNVDLYWLSSARSESTSKLPEAQAKSRTAALEKKGAKAWAENNALRQQIARETPAPPAAQPATADTHDPTPGNLVTGAGLASSSLELLQLTYHQIHLNKGRVRPSHRPRQLARLCSVLILLN